MSTSLLEAINEALREIPEPSTDEEAYIEAVTCGNADDTYAAAYAAGEQAMAAAIRNLIEEATK